MLTSSDRTKRVKDARSEAQKEIEEYKEQKENEFKEFEKEVRLPQLKYSRAWVANKLSSKIRATSKQRRRQRRILIRN